MTRLRRHRACPNPYPAEETARPTRSRLAAVGLGILFASVASISDVRAQDRVVRRFDREADLAPAWVFSLEQDSIGFLWIGTVAGLYRYDGVSVRRWAPELLDARIESLAASRDGRLLVVNGTTAYEVIGDDVYPVIGDGGEPLNDVLAVAFAADCTAFAVAEEGLWREGSAGRWVRIGIRSDHAGVNRIDHGDGGEPNDMDKVDTRYRHVLEPNADGGVDFATSDALWSVGADGQPVHVANITGTRDVLSLDGGRRIVMANDGVGASVFEVDSGRVTELLSLRARGIALARRGDQVWASFDRFLAALRPGAAPEVIGHDDGLESGGIPLVDREGALWIGTASTLRYYPEPETVIWTEQHGLPSRGARFLARTDEGIWTTTWRGTGVIRESASGWNADTVSAFGSIWRMHVDRRGMLWLATDRGLHRLHHGRRLRDYSLRTGLYSVWESDDGRMWFGMLDGLFRLDPGSGAVDRVTGLPFPSDQAIRAVFEDGANRFWVASGPDVCRAREPPEPGVDVSWSCETTPAAPHITSMITLTSGAVWMASENAGVLCWDGDGWTALPGNVRLASRAILNLVPSAAGGVWILGHNVAQRVIEVDGACADWRTLESLSAWHGLPAGPRLDLVEEEDGTLWLTTSHGVVRMPAAARFAEQRPPRVVVVDARVDDEPVSASLQLPHHRNRLELRFAALSFRNPDLIRYQIRLTGDSAWTDARSAPAFRWVDLPAGTYRAEVRASLDGEAWSAEPAAFEFEVMAPWYRQAWALAGFALIAIALLAVAYQVRIGILLRLERQRTMLAMDLHDEVGSGLASIAILSELAGDGADGDADRKTLVNEISTTSQDLSSALSDLVWSLDRRPNTLEDLADRLADHGARLFSNGYARFSVQLPRSWPSTPIAFPVRRGVLLIGLEALHNAARHAGARAVTLSLEREGTSWLLTIEDDGVGLPAGVFDGGGDSGGLGMKSMRDRARRIGAEIKWRSAPDQGTTILVRFGLRGRRRRGLPSLSAKASLGGLPRAALRALRRGVGDRMRPAQRRERPV